MNFLKRFWSWLVMDDEYIKVSNSKMIPKKQKERSEIEDALDSLVTPRYQNFDDFRNLLFERCYPRQMGLYQETLNKLYAEAFKIALNKKGIEVRDGKYRYKQK